MIKVPEYVKNLRAYKAGSQQEKPELLFPEKKPIMMASNENPLGPSPLAKKAMIEAIETQSLYPDPMGSELAAKISEYHNVPQEKIICGHGSESLLAHIINSFADVGDEVLTASGTFVGIFVMTNKLGRKIKTIPLKNRAYDLEEIFNNITDETRIVYLANPNNPTGTMFTRGEFVNFIAKVPEDKLVILDEAYSLYAKQHEGFLDGLEFDYPNLIVMRTLSKTHGLAGVRMGYAIGSEELIQTVYKVKLPFEPSMVAQKAAIAAFDDKEFVKETLKTNDKSLEIILSKLKELGIDYVEPHANFVFMALPSGEIAFEFSQKCYSRSVMVRPLPAFGIPNGIRISTAKVEDTEYAAEVFEIVYKELKEKFNF